MVRTKPFETVTKRCSSWRLKERRQQPITHCQKLMQAASSWVLIHSLKPFPELGSHPVHASRIEIELYKKTRTYSQDASNARVIFVSPGANCATCNSEGNKKFFSRSGRVVLASGFRELGSTVEEGIRGNIQESSITSYIRVIEVSIRKPSRVISIEYLRIESHHESPS